MKNISLWKATAHDSFYPKLDADLHVDAVVIGAGITGLTTALQLSRSGLKTAVVEAWKVGDGTTGFSTGNLYTATDQHYHKIGAHFSDEVLKTVAEARSLALDFIRKFIEEQNIQCEYTSQPFYYYTEDDEHVSRVEKECEAMQKAGLMSQLTELTPLPFSVKKACMLPAQARFNPMQYVKELAAYVSGGEVFIFENTKMVSVDDKDPDGDEPSVVHCETGKIYARYVIMATHVPKGFDMTQTMLGPYRKYAIACRLSDGVYPHGVFWDTTPNSHHSTTSHKGAAGDFLIIIGGGHKTGQKEDNEEDYRQLENYARERYQIASIDYRWSAQHYRPADGLPFIGKSLDSHVYIATGYSTDGLIWGTAAGIHIAEMITNRARPNWAHAFNPARFTPLASARDFLKENINNVGYYIRDYILKSDFEKLSQLQTGEGELVELHGEKLAVYKGEDNRLSVLSPICPHMKCIVHWNKAEKTWDCPCHGSRFTCEGRCIEGPSIADLAQKEVRDI
jgi:glycine/D-amino acid oxidase-like deaminating enzyme/nitrite reductase/ring-hydroxylating ferredoxin subunit